MPRDFPEPDWKILSRLKPLALDRLCQRILQEAGDILGQAKEKEYHRAYLDLYKYVHKNDERVVNCFDDWKRSQAVYILMNWMSEKLLTEVEFNAFSPETREVVERFLKSV